MGATMKEAAADLSPELRAVRDVVIYPSAPAAVRAPPRRPSSPFPLSPVGSR